MTQREREARKEACRIHAKMPKPKREPGTMEPSPVMAENFCGAWIIDPGGRSQGHECHVPICRECADVRLNIWLCPACASKKAEVAA